MIIGSKIKELRKAQKLTQAELSLKANISRSYLADIERNRYNPSVDTLTSLAEALNITLSKLVDINNNNSDLISETPKKYFIEQYLLTLGYNIIYDSEGNIILDAPDAQYEISEFDIEDLQKSVDSFTKFKLSELMSKNKHVPKTNTSMPIAAHNDFADDPEQQKLMKEDLDEL